MEGIQAAGLEIAYERVGQGPPLVFVHGAAEDGRVWRPQLAALADEFTVVAWDEPGAGRSSDVPAALISAEPVAVAALVAILLTGAGVFVRQELQARVDSTLAASLRAHAADVAALAQQSDTGLADATGSPSVGALPQLAQIVDARGRVIDATAGLPHRPLLGAAALDRARTRNVVIPRTRLGRDQPVRLLGMPVAAQGQRLVVIVGQSLEERPLLLVPEEDRPGLEVADARVDEHRPARPLDHRRLHPQADVAVGVRRRAGRDHAGVLQVGFELLQMFA